MSQAREWVFVEAPGRLHFGVLDLGGSLGRWFGGIGTAAPVRPLLVSATTSTSGALECEGDESDRASEFAQRFLRSHNLDAGAHLRVHHALPRHVGLGSGTQLALAVSRALAELHGCDTRVESLAQAVGRTQRSGVGMWVFADGGLVVEGGRRSETSVPPLVARVPFPLSWRCIVVIPRRPGGISGDAERAAFESLKGHSIAEAERVSHQVLMALLPAIVEADLDAFGEALSEIQRITGGWFAPIQGGVFSAESAAVVDEMQALGARGVGQSSWGPVVYGLADGDSQVDAIATEMRRRLGAAAQVITGPFRREGARVWRQPDSNIVIGN